MKYKIARVAIIGIICICSVYYLFSHYDGKEYTIENMEEYVRSLCKIGNVPGMSIAVLDHGRNIILMSGMQIKLKKQT